jgi:UrcA family protein
MFTKSILATLTVVVATTFSAQDVGSVPTSAPRPSAGARSESWVPAADQRLPVRAATGAEATVRFGDLDLSTPAGARLMLRRIDNAAGQVCGEEAACVRATEDGAVSTLASPDVAALHAASATVPTSDRG